MSKVQSKEIFGGKTGGNYKIGHRNHFHTRPYKITKQSGSSQRSDGRQNCFGPYDNLVEYVWEIDTSTGDRFAYVDCDYVE